MGTDKPLLAGVFSLIAIPLAEIFSQSMKYLGFTNLSAAEAMSLLWLKEPNVFMLLYAGVIFGAGILTYYSARILGTDYFPIKAMLINMTFESLFFNIFGVLAHNELLIQNAIGNYVHASAAATFGIFPGMLMKKYLFKSSNAYSVKPEPLLAILISWPGWLISEGITQLAKLFGFTSLTTLETISLMWMTKPSIPLGILGFFGLGSWLGLIYYYSTYIWNTDYFAIKTALLALTGHSLLVQVFGVLGGNELLVQNISGTLVHALGAALNGLFAGILMKRILFQSDKVAD